MRSGASADHFAREHEWDIQVASVGANPVEPPTGSSPPSRPLQARLASGDQGSASHVPNLATSPPRPCTGGWKERPSAKTIFSQTDAVSFVLRDDAGRVLVLGRRARWDSSGGQPGNVPRADAVDLAKELGRPLEDAQDYLDSYSDPDSSEQGRGDQTEKLVAVGERVTVTGRAFADPAEILWGSDTCPDAGQRIGLSGAFVVGPDRLSGLSIVSGYSGGVTSKGRARLLLGLFGLAGAFVVVIGSVVVILAGSA